MIFVSHAHEDSAALRYVVAELEGAGLACWYAPRDISPGDRWPESIAQAVESADFVLLLLSAASNNSEAVASEITQASSHGKVVVPFRLEDVRPSPKLRMFLSTVQWLDGHKDGLATATSQLLTAARLRVQQTPGSGAAGTVPVSSEPHKKIALDLRLPGRQRWNVWIDIATKLKLSFAADDSELTTTLMMFNQHYRLTVDGATEQAGNINLILHTAAYEFSQTNHTPEGLHNQFVAAIRRLDGNTEVTDRRDTRDGVGAQVTDPLLDGLATNAVKMGYALTVDSHGRVLAARALGDPLDASELRGPSSKLAAGIGWLAMPKDAAHYFANNLVPELPSQPVAEGATWPRKQTLTIMGLDIASVGNATVIGTTHPMVELVERGTDSFETKSLEAGISSVVQALLGKTAEVALSAPLEATYTRRWQFDQGRGWPRTMESRLDNLNLRAHATMVLEDEPTQVTINCKGSATTQVGWESI